MTDYAVELVESRRYLTDPFVVNYVGGSPSRFSVPLPISFGMERNLRAFSASILISSSILEARKILDQVLILDPALLGQEAGNLLLGSSAVEK